MGYNKGEQISQSRRVNAHWHFSRWRAKAMSDNTPDTPTKQCSKCGAEYPATTEYWYKLKSGKYGLCAECKECRNERSREYRRGLIITSAPEGATKTCTKCSAVYPATTEYWDKYKGGKYGLCAECKSCKAEYRRQYYEANRDKELEIQRQYREANGDKIREISRKYRETNPDKVRESCRESCRKWREANPDKERERKRQWREANPDKLRTYNHNRRARIVQAEGSHTADELYEQFKRQRGKCYWCGCKLDKNNYHEDHVMPIARGGDNYISNIVCTCPVCNLSKGAKLPHEWKGTDRLL